MKDRLWILKAIAGMIIEQKAWWMTPIVLVLLLVVGLALVGSSSPLAPFIYPLF